MVDEQMTVEEALALARERWDVTAALIVLADAVERVRALHIRQAGELGPELLDGSRKIAPDYCRHCLDPDEMNTDWPCPTMQVLG